MRNTPAGNHRRSRLLEAGAWTFGALLIVTYFGARAFGEMEREQAVATFEQAQSQSPPPHSALRRVPVQNDWSDSRIRAHAAVAAESGETAAPPAALLRIRRVGLAVPVYGDASERNLNRGAGLIAGTSAPLGDGNTGIAAHRDGYFRVLEQVVVGDVLDLETHSGQRRYRVAELSIVQPTDMSPLDATDAPAITLVTCYPFYFAGPAPLRYIVRAVAID